MPRISKVELQKYQYGINIQKQYKIYGLSGKEIYMGRWIPNTNQSVIIIEMNKQIDRNESLFYELLNGHNHIIHTYGYVENILDLKIFVQDYATLGDLSNLFFDTNIHLTELMLYEIFCQIVNAMKYVSEKCIVHGDLGCRNVLVYRIDSTKPKNILVKLTDFGLSRLINRPSYNRDNLSIIPVRFCAPEILENNCHSNYTEKSDVYSMGVFMWEALSNGEFPYSSISSDEEVKKVKLDRILLSRPQICHRSLWDLIKKCWPFNRDERFTFAQLEDELNYINPSVLSHVKENVSFTSLSLTYAFKLNVDIQINGSIKTSSRKVYMARWINKTERDIVLIKLHNQPNEYELSFYNELKNPHLVHTFGFVENDLNSLIIVQEHAPHGNLRKLLLKNSYKFSLEVFVELFLQIIDAMIYISENNLVHGNLCCSNVLVFKINESNPKENLIKLTEFSSSFINDRSSSRTDRPTLSVRHCAPEILRSVNQSNYSELSDVYSTGVLMWEVCSNGETPYSTSILISEVRKRILNGERLIKPLLCNDQIWSIIEDCWYNEPLLRYNFKGMKHRLSRIDFNVKQIHEFQMDVDVKIIKALDGDFGKKTFLAEWIPKRDQPIILLLMNENRAQQEIAFSFDLNGNEHIVQSFGLVKTDSRSIIVAQEYSPYGNLETLLKKGQFTPTSHVLINIFLQIIDGLIYIRSRDAVYNSLCCENTLVFRMNSFNSNENLIKLTNFNRARFHNDKTPIDIPVRYCAPEIFSTSNYSEFSDVYSIGILMWQAFSKGELPFGSHKTDESVRQARLNNEYLQRPEQCDDALWNIADDCFLSEPSLRFRFHEIQKRLLNLLNG